MSSGARIRIGVVSIGTRGASGPIGFDIARTLAGIGPKVEVFGVLSDYGGYHAYWKEAGIPYFSAPTYRNALRAAVEWLVPIQTHRIAQEIRARQPDVLVYPMFYTWNPLVQRFLKDIPNVVAVHDPKPHPGLLSRVFKAMEDQSIRLATRGIIFSQVFVEDIARRGLAEERLDVLPLGDISFYQRWSHEHEQGTKPRLENRGEEPQNTRKETYGEEEGEEGSKGGAPVLLFFGRIVEYKGLEVLLQAYRLVRRRQNARLLVVGEGDIRPYRALLEGLPDVKLVNRWIADEEIGGYFHQADVVVLPYTSASQSGIVQIAASYALPVVATRVGGLPEQVMDGESGLLVEPKSVNELAEAVLRLLEQPDLGKTLGRNLQKVFQVERGWEVIARKLLAVCEKAKITNDAPKTAGE